MQLSIVVPVYQSADCLSELAFRVQQEIGSDFETYELILVNDNSPDTSWDVIVHLTEKYDFHHRGEFAQERGTGQCHNGWSSLCRR
jgi:glycosyltransferase involved in cell wall biosynthesis